MDETYIMMMIYPEEDIIILISIFHIGWKEIHAGIEPHYKLILRHMNIMY